MAESDPPRPNGEEKIAPTAPDAGSLPGAGASVGGELRLASDRHYTGDAKQIEFAANPPEVRIRGAADVLREIAMAADGLGPAGGDLVRVCFTLLRLPPGSPFSLFGFNLVDVGPEGRVVDEVSSDTEIVYALIVNQPVAVIRETAVRFLLDLVRRQAVVMQVAREDRDSLERLPSRVAEGDSANADLALDLPPAVPAAMAALGDLTASVGVRLIVRFRPDPFPSQADTARRVSELRDLYNKEEAVHSAVDRAVAELGARPMSIRGGREDIRQFISRRATLQGWQQYTNQAVRDAIVCGNGYLSMTMLGLEGRMRCLRPEKVIIRGDGSYSEIGSSTTLPGPSVAHLPGITQIQSPYGVSWLEPFLFLLTRRRLYASALSFARSVQIEMVSDESKERLESTLVMIRTFNEEADARRDALLAGFPRERTDPTEGLFFPGQEQMR
jgi:hypothetical protein